MATFYDDILAGLTSLFNYSLNCDFHENMAHFHIINDFFKVIPVQQFSIDLPNLKTILFKTARSFILGQRKRNKKTYILIYGLTTLNKAKSGQVSTNKGIIT